MDENRNKQIREIIEKQQNGKDDFSRTRSSFFSARSSKSIPEKIDDEEQRKKRIENDGSEQDIELKRTTLNALLMFLRWETIAVFTIAFFQGFGNHGWFKVDEWGFRTLVVSTILQITAMLHIAVQNLFPRKK